MPINEWSDAILIAELSDEPAFSEDMENLIRRLDSDDAADSAIINLQRVSYLNSSNISQLLKVRKRVIERGGSLRLCALNDSVWSVMLATGLDKVFEFTEDVSTSLASIMIGGG